MFYVELRQLLGHVKQVAKLFRVASGLELFAELFRRVPRPASKKQEQVLEYAFPLGLRAQNATR
ncbi:hypothetical protein [Thermodesulfitimonas sp.]